MMRLTRRIALAVLGLTAGMVGRAEAQLIHDYRLDGNYHDSVAGGQDIVSNGGTVEATGYRFGRNQGLTLSNPGVTNSYSIEMTFNFTEDYGGYKKLIDYKNLSEDNGFYAVGNNGLRLYPYAYPTLSIQGPSLSSSATVVVSRDGATKQLTASVNGTTVYSVEDWLGVGIIDSSLGLKFFMDDSVTSGNEAYPGFVDRIRIYNTATISASDPGPANVPEPASIAMAGTSALVGLGVAWRRRRRAA